MRNDRGLTMKALAQAAGMSKDYLLKTELEGRNLSWDKLSGLAVGLKTTVAELAANVEEEARGDQIAERRSPPSRSKQPSAERKQPSSTKRKPPSPGR